ncbi:MAG: hypothetical protein KDC24_01360 [Saprospiraceae bacterium]|nr:hypothetical protein [Saprospiraceae bacterium]
MEEKNFYLVVPTDLRYFKIEDKNKHHAYNYPGQLADFSRLPHNGLRTDNGCIFPRYSPNVSEDLVTKPFEATAYPLRKGVHVHFSLPSVFRKVRFIDSEEGQSKGIFRDAPNRWLIRRWVTAKDGKVRNTKEFLLESDALSLEKPENSNSIPYKSINYRKGDIPFRFLGNLSTLEKDSNAKYTLVSEVETLEYLKGLNAFGYGEPLFSAYYPECRNVFGFHDDLSDLNKNEPNVNLSYEIVGWREEKDSDPFYTGKLVFQHEHTLQNQDQNPESPQQISVTEILKPFRLEDGGETIDWEITLDGKTCLPSNLDPFTDNIFGRNLYVGRINDINFDFDKKNKEKASDKNLSKTKIVIGNTPGQALAALLASKEKGNNVQAKELMFDAFQLGLFSNPDKIDLLARVDNGIHKSAFAPESGGITWTIEKSKPDISQQSDQKETFQNLSEEFNSKAKNDLVKLNGLQKQADRLSFCLEEKRLQLYADWYKYMISEYNLNLGPITRENRVNEIRYHLMYAANEILNHEKELAETRGNIQMLENEISTLLNKWNNETKTIHYNYALKSKQASRFWSPSEPTILFHGDHIETPKRLHEKSTLSVMMFQSEAGLSDDTLMAVSQLREMFSTIFDCYDQLTNSKTAKQVAWEPLFLDWQVKINPTTKPFDLDENQINWSSNAILDNYTLADKEIDLKRSEGSADAGKTQVVEGRSILSPSADKALSHHLNEERKKIPEAIKELNIRIGELKDEIEEQKATKQQLKDKITELTILYKSLDGRIAELNSLNVLSQSLSGFNDACLMMKQILQLEVEDPLADNKELDKFSNQIIKEAIGKANLVSPLPSNFFIPIRDGWMKINRLRIVDCFGEYIEWEHSEALKDQKKIAQNAPEIIIAESLKPDWLKDHPYARYSAYLPPRIIQPTRLNLAFADPNNEGQSFVPGFADANPVIGWVMPNFLDGTLYLYDTDGYALGFLQEQGQSNGDSHIYFLKTPGEEIARERKNIHLDNWIEFFKNQKGKYLRDFIKNSLRALKTVDPENYANFSGINSLLGKPLAIVKLEVSLEVKGEIAKNQSWSSRLDFFRSSNKNFNASMLFEKVEFPFRIGDVAQSNDGLVGYYLIKNGKPQFEEFYCFHSNQEVNVPAFQLNSLVEMGNIMETTFARMDAAHLPLTEDELTRLRELRNKGKLVSNDEKSERDKLEQKNQSFEEYKEIKEIAKTNLDKQLSEAEKGVQIGIYKKPRNKDLIVTINPSGTITKKAELLVIMDPRAKVHVTTGILPVKSIQLDAHLVGDAINNIDAAFLTTPILSPPSQIVFPTLVDDQFSWTWLEKNRQKDLSEKWNHIDAGNFLQPSDDFLPLEDNVVLKEGWLKINSKPTKKSENE